ncbi:response regulator [Oscillatoria sp. FACHB-1407]|uniref:hybrid sensor histidine kinase/response regulator n=1 Tax=Oscillatoria sp. FACHB-1407 TaxID=2692847 RepID=UPI001687246E|nr:ATP-binding protein [Oscillatoria sp. FACHB-1407]MBD2461353.1 response regulator [Oscillatoria sp. FACHB-1407]
MLATKILIVEDEAIVAEDIASCLEKMGYIIVDVVASSNAAIAAAVKYSPDLVLMDIMLQGEIDGIETSQSICSKLNIPVVYLTANADESTLERAKETGPFGYIIKPFKDRELRAAIEIALSRHQTEIETQKALAAAEALRQKAEETSELKSLYLSIASHEFRTPLSIIRMATELLQNYSNQMPECKRQQNLQRIQTATDSMNLLLEDVLMLGQVESGTLEIHLVPVELVSFCQEMIEMLQLSAGEKHCLEFRCNKAAIQAMIDEKLVWYLLNNLLVNAIKYSPEGGSVLLTLHLQDDQLCLQVQDQGIGIPLEHQTQLFEPFKRARNVGNIPGTGLGLAIAKRSVDLHQGQISFVSSPGEGTTFTVQLPFYPTPTGTVLS